MGNHRVLEDCEGAWRTIEMIGKEDQGETIEFWRTVKAYGEP